jgi:hypothetical protein
MGSAEEQSPGDDCWWVLPAADTREDAGERRVWTFS